MEDEEFENDVGAHPTLEVLIKRIQIEQGATETLWQQVTVRGDVFPHGRRTKEKYERIKMVTETFDETNIDLFFDQIALALKDQ